jgi:hypothetical protein
MKKNYKAHEITSTAVQNPDSKLFRPHVVILEPPAGTPHRTSHEFDLEATFQTVAEAESYGMNWAMTERVDRYTPAASGEDP